MSLQHRLQEAETPLQKAGEGLSEVVRQMIRVSEIRTQKKTLEEEEKALVQTLTAHIKETGEVVTNGAYKASLEPANSVSYDEEALAMVLGARFNDCMDFVFNKKKLEALVLMGEVKESEIAPSRITKVTDRLMIRTDKEKP